MKKSRFVAFSALVLCFIMLCSCSLANSDRETADLVVYGDIYTADEDGNFAEAFAVKDGKYIYVGTSEGAEKYIGSKTEVVNAGFVMPSGVESHAHYILEEAFKLGLYIEITKEDGSYKTMEEIVQDIVAYREENPDVDGIFGYKWSKFYCLISGEQATRQLIDEYIDDIPVYISGNDLHSGWCNTKCLELAGALYDEIPPEGVVRDENGVATGRINDEACSYIRNKVFGSVGNYYQAVLNSQEILLSEGYTMLLDPWSNFDSTTDMYEALKKADENGDLKMQVFTSYCVDTYDDYDEEIEVAAEVKDSYTTEHSQAKFIKLFCDGTEDAKTAFQLEPYSDGTYGTDNWDPEAMDYVTINANKEGLLVHIHAYGDASARQSINSFEKSYIENGKSYRNSLAHAPYVTDSDLERIADLEIGISGSGNWGVGSGSQAWDNYMISFLGADRYKDYYIVDKFVDYGIKAGMSTDRPCADGFVEDIFDYIGYLTTGVDYRPGYETTAKRDKWVSVEDAIKMMTINGAWSLDADSERGSIETGKYADFIIATGNPFETELSKINEINVAQTFFEGQSVYKLSDN